MKLKKFSQFINEAGDATSTEIADALKSTPNTVTAVPTPSGLKIKAVYDPKSKLGGLRVIGSKGNHDYRINIALPAYTGPVMPVNFWKEEKGPYYIKTNVGQIRELSQEDINQLLGLYRTGEYSKTVDGWVADVTFIKTNDLKDIA